MSKQLANINPILSELDKTQLENEGKVLYKKNANMSSLGNIMEHPEFRTFYDQHFKDWDSVKVIVMFMKTYEMIEKSDPGLTPYQKLAILKYMIGNSELRSSITQCMLEWSGIKRIINDYKSGIIKVKPLEPSLGEEFKLLTDNNESN